MHALRTPLVRPHRRPRAGRPKILAAGLLAWASVTSAGGGEPVGFPPADPDTQPHPQARSDRVDVLRSTTAERKRYDHIAVVRVAPRTARQLNAALAMAATLWSERHGLGPFEIAVDRARIADLRAIGLEPEVLIENLQTVVDEEWSMIRDVARRRGGGGYYDVYRQLHEIEARLDTLAQQHASLASVFTYGQSIEGRDLKGIRITGPGDPSARPHIVWNGGQHAREWINPAVTTYLAEQLLTLYATDDEVREFVDSAVFVIVPVANPDGYVYSWTDERFWRKNRRDGHGVDLNRNWSTAWGGPGSASSTSSSTYRGTTPFSEPETAALRDLILAQPNLVGHLDIHSFSQLILRPNGFEFSEPPGLDGVFLQALGDAMQERVFSVHGETYVSQPAWQLYLASGINSDWAYHEAGAVSFTLELRPVGGAGFAVDPSNIIPCGEEVFEGIREYVARVTAPFVVEPIEDAPAVIDAGVPMPIEVTTLRLADRPPPVSATLWHRVRTDPENAFAPAPMTTGGDGRYSGEVPALECGATVEFFVEFTPAGGDPIRTPPDGVLSTDARDIDRLAVDDAELDTGWVIGSPDDTAFRGVWGLTEPFGTGYQPGADTSPNGTRCWVTDGRFAPNPVVNDVDGGLTTLTSPRYDATTPHSLPGETWLTYQYWLTTRGAPSDPPDSFTVLISNDDGQNWTVLDTVTDAAEAWRTRRVHLGPIIEPSDSMRLRFIAEDAAQDTLVEAAVDDIVFSFESCAPGFSPDWDDDGDTDIFDVIAFLADFSASDPDTDLDGDGEIDVFDVILFLQVFSASPGE